MAEDAIRLRDWILDSAGLEAQSMPIAIRILWLMDRKRWEAYEREHTPNTLEEGVELVLSYLEAAINRTAAQVAGSPAEEKCLLSPSPPAEEESLLSPSPPAEEKCLLVAPSEPHPSPAREGDPHQSPAREGDPHQSPARVGDPHQSPAREGDLIAWVSASPVAAWCSASPGAAWCSASPGAACCSTSPRAACCPASQQEVLWLEPHHGELPATKKGEEVQRPPNPAAVSLPEIVGEVRPAPTTALLLPEVLWPELPATKG
ncbi:UNVERIFIED_CONTAM: hypothetical protein FKN15_062072 [Acipenser sinensis]